MYKLLLMVTDAFMLERGTQPHCYFDCSGGFIGAGSSAQWKINNLKNKFSDIEFEIKYYNASFCLITHTKNIFINNATRPLPEGGIIKLNDNDLISLFNYKLRVKVFTNETDIVTLQDELSYLVNKVTDKTILHLDYQKDACFINSFKEDDELLMLKENSQNLDPLLALKVDEKLHEKIIGDACHQVRNVDYKFFNQHIESGLEYYVPPDFIASSDEFKLDNLIVKNEILQQDGVSSLSKNKTENSDNVILDPLFFIK
ncbi:hypothetical protein [Actinobacillus equuli]|uniref:hypothetical protein n=1 Tax=Actinobacillus equuli TaxID=718 RepID=UPI00244341F1|nr:hypothetical protein [Actinobacillus equuli]WGE43083.1 hypothetical protein NYR64_04375 [Actinobacillus equuli subsp. haemolyticus]WGE47457.1 hypothetical protein NYR84_04485 [Actinobacillus equuli subsp. haemolyticus]WGE51674.1 hypothetical protein NYR68_04625 [Actinobacillus equuli subsp. haemolyticus]WGE53782.1 hypothetical protein NYR69_04275 [Actinobacillus equuli subsp. haemolyticus]WGE59952.1 hypothetical protein NYR73_04365 [Actinobacillus equuli subsp. haemolyticus]